MRDNTSPICPPKGDLILPPYRLSRYLPVLSSCPSVLAFNSKIQFSGEISNYKCTITLLFLLFLLLFSPSVKSTKSSLFKGLSLCTCTLRDVCRGSSTRTLPQSYSPSPSHVSYCFLPLSFRTEAAFGLCRGQQAYSALDLSQKNY